MFRNYLKVLSFSSSVTSSNVNKQCILNKIAHFYESLYCNHSNYSNRLNHTVVASSNVLRNLRLSTNFNSKNFCGKTDTSAKNIIFKTPESTLCEYSENKQDQHQMVKSGDQIGSTLGSQAIGPSGIDLFEDINFDEITGGDEEKTNSFKLLMLELDVMRQDGMCVPSKMSTEQWKELFALQTRSQRRKYLMYLFKTEMKKLNEKRKKTLKREATEQARSENTLKLIDGPAEHIRYGFQGSTIFVRIYDTTINAHDNNRLIQAMMFGHNLVIDCGFYNDMNQMENKLCCKQLVYLFAENRISKNPFNIHFCNLKKDSCLYHFLKKSIPTIEDPAFPINIHEGHYLNLFQKEKLVYLTPHCRTELKEFNPDDIYIIGAIVDRVNQMPLTLAKAKSEGLRMAQLPLDRYLEWGLGNKSLTVNQVVKIMHDLQVTGNWDTAFKHVPRRKIRVPGEHVRDPRRQYKRGTTLQPSTYFIKKNY
ncbi:mitochondrial ribonuclease P protein 1 homolog [Macrosteles quadrilineatus]|uniref:mitochondrial ribonuclease P protein 1 homolog n=1 Tax=Macrosteles quadrilineatus TaxID=74068 RepID=UPI0023E231A8|nr:mitochondrial ribonuclease P protein 1 homolog [Macrosteles quadrilineatus]